MRSISLIMSQFQTLTAQRLVLRFVFYSKNTDMLIAASEKINDLSNTTKKKLSLQSNSLPLLLYSFCGFFVAVLVQTTGRLKPDTILNCELLCDPTVGKNYKDVCE
jgi:hypothetical protein